MMKKVIVALCLAVIPVWAGYGVDAAEEAKKTGPTEFRIRGELIAHPESNDVKVLTESYEAVTIQVDKKTRINASVKGSLGDMAKEAETRLPRGEVTFILVDDKPVATRINFNSGQNWKVSPPKTKDD